MYKINQKKLDDIRKKASKVYVDSDISTELNDYIFIDAVCELLEIEKLINHENVLDEKKVTGDFNVKINFFGFDIKTTQSLSTYLSKYFLYALSSEKIIENIIDLPIATIGSTNDMINKIKILDVSFDYDIPYLAGYSENGKIIYIDKTVNLDRNSNEVLALVLHEYVEKTLFNLFKTRDNLYFKTHQIALKIEKLFVENIMASWDRYDLLMKNYITRAAKKTTYELPADLDVTPYRDCGYEEFYFSEKNGLKIVLTIPVFLKSFEQNYNKNRIEEIKEYCSDINSVFYNCSGKFIGLNDYISKSKDNIFGYIDRSKYYKTELCGVNFLVKEAFIYYGYGIGYFDIILNSIDYIDYSQVELLQLNNELVEKKESNLYENFFKLLNEIETNFLETDSYLTTSFAISFFIFSNDINIDEKYLISTKICGENQSAKNIDEFMKSGLKDLYINHGFTGSVYCFDNKDDSIALNSIVSMNNFLYLVSSVIPELNFLTQSIIKRSANLSASDSYDVIENHLSILKNIREKIDSFIFDIYPQNVDEFAVDASIYDKAFETWEFEKYIDILKEQNKKIENLIQEFDIKLKHISDKKLNVFVKLLTGFSATSVFVDIFSHIDIKMGIYFLLVPIILLIIGIFM